MENVIPNDLLEDLFIIVVVLFSNIFLFIIYLNKIYHNINWRSSSVGQSARLIFVMSGVQIPPPLPLFCCNFSTIVITDQNISRDGAAR